VRPDIVELLSRDLADTPGPDVAVRERLASRLHAQMWGPQSPDGRATIRNRPKLIGEFLTQGRMLRRSAALGFIGLVAAIVVMATLASGRGPSVAKKVAVTPAHHAHVTHGLAMPNCQLATGSVPSTVDVSTSLSDTFNSSCYYAPADTPFTIAFTNNVAAAGSGTSVPLTLMISPASDPAVQYESGTSGEFVVNPENAVFVAQTAVASSGDNATDLSVPALSAGTYALTTEQLPTTCFATLVVQ
jgi:hypothetical protein